MRVKKNHFNWKSSFLSLFIIILLSSPALPQEPVLVPLYAWYSDLYKDHLTTTDQSWKYEPNVIHQPDYNYFRTKGMVFSPAQPQPPSTVPLYGWWSPSRKDRLITSDVRWAGRPADIIAPDYQFVRLEGYIFDTPYAGTIPFQSLWSSTRSDNFTTSDWELIGQIGENRSPNYAIFRTEGYVIPAESPYPPDLSKNFGYGNLRINDIKAIGSRPLLVLLMEYSDVRFRSPHTRTYYDNLVFGSSAANIAGFFRNNSYNTFNWIKAGVLWPFTHPDDPATPSVDESMFNCANNYKFPNDDPACPGASGPWEEVFIGAVQWAATTGGVDFTQYDKNNDNEITSDELTIMVFNAQPPDSRDASIYPEVWARAGANRNYCVNIAGGLRVCGKISSIGELFLKED